MLRMIYLCPADNAPTGGVKVIYRHAELLDALGVEAFVLHPFDLEFRCDWFEHGASMLRDMVLFPGKDLVVIPEIWAPIFAKQCRDQAIRYAIFVQNGYLTHAVMPNVTAQDMAEAYGGASLILTISKDTAEMVKLNYPGLDRGQFVPTQYSVHERFLPRDDGAARTKIITYMPRKMADHAVRVIHALARNLPTDWTIMPIHNVDEKTCADLLSKSSVFLAFSEFEGLPLPPLEAALAGNIVVGYTGQGAKEYWEYPVFREIAQGDVIGFVRAACEAANEVDGGIQSSPGFQDVRQRLAKAYSAESEKAAVSDMIGRVFSCLGAVQRAA